MNTLRMPIKFNKETLEMETIPENSDEYFAVLVGFAVQIAPGSLPISTFYGVEDPTFDTKLVNSVTAKLSGLIPEIRIKESTVVPNNNGQTNLSIKFERI